MNENHTAAAARRLGRGFVKRVVSAARRRGSWGWLGLGLCVAGVLEVPWIFVLAATLSSSQFPATWIGLDICEAIGLMATGLGLLRRDSRGALAAAVTATLLALDAWFDVTTATTGADRLAALAMASGAEIPIAAACVAVAVHLSANVASTDPDGPSGRTRNRANDDGMAAGNPAHTSGGSAADTFRSSGCRPTPVDPAVARQVRRGRQLSIANPEWVHGVHRTAVDVPA